MDSTLSPTATTRRPTRLAPRVTGCAASLAVLLFAVPVLAQTDDLKSNIDAAGSAAGRQIEQWLGAPAPKPKSSRKAVAGKPAARAAAAPAAVPLPQPRPAEAGARPEEEAAESQAAEAAAETAPAEPTGKSARSPARTAPLALAPRTPAVPAPAVEPDYPEAEGVPLPPERPDRVAALPLPVTSAPGPVPSTTIRGAAVNVPLPPERPGRAPAPAESSEAEAPDAAATAGTEARVPLPPPRPAAEGETRTAMLTPPTASQSAPAAPVSGFGGSNYCPEITTADIGTIEAAQPKTSPGCRVERPVALTGVKLKDGRTVPLSPAAVLRCDTAAAIARWVRDGVAPAVETLGSPLAEVEVADSYACRSRNRVKGAKLSEHATGRAMDTRGYRLADGRRLLIGGTGAEAMPIAFQEQLKASACADFMTILGPGSDGFHELHLHVDRAERRNNMVLCRWAIGTPPPTGKAEAKARAGDKITPSTPAATGAAPEAPPPAEDAIPSDEVETDGALDDTPATPPPANSKSTRK